EGSLATLVPSLDRSAREQAQAVGGVEIALDARGGLGLDLELDEHGPRSVEVDARVFIGEAAMGDLGGAATGRERGLAARRTGAQEVVGKLGRARPVALEVAGDRRVKPTAPLRFDPQREHLGDPNVAEAPAAAADRGDDRRFAGL